MSTLLLSISAIVLLIVAGYVQYRIPNFTRRRSDANLTRAVLLLVGVAFGYLCTRYALARIDAYLAFLSGLGLVHLPAGVILFLKRARGEGRS
jgi:predicted membrane protein